MEKDHPVREDDPEPVERWIRVVRGEKVLFDFDLARLYGVETRVLVQAVKRNPDRFPDDFMFQLSKAELADWRSRFVISNPGARTVCGTNRQSDQLFVSARSAFVRRTRSWRNSGAKSAPFGQVSVS